MSSAIIAIRTHRFGGRIRDWAWRILRESGCRVVVVADESRRPVPVPGDFAKVPVSKAWARSRSLHTPANAMWRCGDYSLYAVREAVPDAAQIWLLEHDVRINGGDLGRFFGAGAAWPEADLLAAFYRRAEPDWAWYGSVAPLYATPYRCLFPILRISAAAVDALYRERVAISREFARSARLPDWPNDEAFVASFLTCSGHVCRDLNHGGARLYDETTFSWRERPHSEKQLAAAPRDGRLYHPVLGGRDYLLAMRRALAMRAAHAPGEIAAQFGDAALRWVAAECGEEAARAFAAEVASALRAHSPEPAAMAGSGR